MKDYSKEYNTLPREVRHIAGMVNTQMRINQLRIDRDRIIKHNKALIREVNEHISNLEKWLQKEGGITSHAPELANAMQENVYPTCSKCGSKLFTHGIYMLCPVGCVPANASG